MLCERIRRECGITSTSRSDKLNAARIQREGARVVNKLGNGRLEILSTATLTVIVVWSVTPCSLVEIYRSFRNKSVAFIFNIIDFLTLKMFYERLAWMGGLFVSACVRVTPFRAQSQ
jgi:hypothetical protein